MRARNHTAPGSHLLRASLACILATCATTLVGGAACAADGLRAPTLRILTTTLGGVGRFTYIAGPYDDDPTEVHALTRWPGVAAAAQPERNLALLSSNRYVIQQLPGALRGGHWALFAVFCNGRRLVIHSQPISRFRYVKLRLRFGQPTVCSFVDRFVRARR